MSIRIAGTGSYAPERQLTNADLEKMVNTSDEWIRTRTGICTRHIASEEQATSDLAFEAAKQALKSANCTAKDLDAILVGTVTPDYAFPSTACLLQSQLKAPKVMAFDLEAACSGMIYCLEVAHSMLESKRFRRILVVCADKLSCITNWKDRNTCVLFGDGAGAVVLEEDGGEGENTLQASDLHSDGGYGEMLSLPAGGSRLPQTPETLAAGQQYIHMEGKDVFKLAVSGMVSSCNNVLKKAGKKASEIKIVVPHQANCRIIEAVAERIKVTPEQVYINIDRYGNTSAASIGICLDELVRAGKIQRGDLLLLTAFGGGMTWGAMLLRY